MTTKTTTTTRTFAYTIQASHDADTWVPGALLTMTTTATPADVAEEAITYAVAEAIFTGDETPWLRVLVWEGHSERTAENSDASVAVHLGDAREAVREAILDVLM
jgi:hypothetical protein